MVSQHQLLFTRTLLIISHIIVALFTAWGAILERALLARPDLPESSFWYNDLLVGVSCIIFFVLPVLLFYNLRWYKIIALVSYLLISAFWYYVVYFEAQALKVFIRLEAPLQYFHFATVFYLFCVALYLCTIFVIIKSILKQESSVLKWN